jgi:hypothetical protein
MMSRGVKGAPPKLVDVESRASRHKIPSRDEREDLWPGDLAKVILDDVGWRIWVRVADVMMDCFYVGSVVSSPLYAGCQMGDRLVFGPENIAGIERKCIPGFDRPVGRRKLGMKTMLQ